MDQTRYIAGAMSGTSADGVDVALTRVEGTGLGVSACLVLHRTAFEAVGGLDPELQVAFNDVDFCLRLEASGYRDFTLLRPGSGSREWLAAERRLRELGSSDSRGRLLQAAALRRDEALLDAILASLDHGQG